MFDPKPPVPPALEPTYSTAKANSDVTLYDGPVKLVQPSREFSGRGTIAIQWAPSPAYVFNVVLDEPSFSVQLTEARLELTDVLATAEVDVTSSRPSSSSPTIVAGRLMNSLHVGVESRVAMVQFHVPNFPEVIGGSSFYFRPVGESNHRCDRIVLEGAGYEVVLDPVPGLGDLIKDVKATRGFGLTYVGQLKRPGSDLAIDDVDDLMQALGRLLSFACGRRCLPTLLVGLSATGEKLWERWNPTTMPANWSTVLTWFDVNHGKALADVFPGFISRWKDELWGETIRDAIYWFCLSSGFSAGADGSTVLAQITLEMLAWVQIVEHSRLKSEAAFDRLPAQDKLTLLLNELGIPLDVPDYLDNLVKAAERDKLNGPGCVVALRNAIVHRTRKKRKAVEIFDTIGDRAQLANWYVELCLLNLFGYKGNYSNRLKYRHVGEVEPVPWAVPSSA